MKLTILLISVSLCACADFCIEVEPVTAGARPNIVEHNTHEKDDGIYEFTAGLRCHITKAFNLSAALGGEFDTNTVDPTVDTGVVGFQLRI